MIGGKFGRTYVSGDNRRASSMRLGTPASHSTAHNLSFGGGSNSSATSVIPKRVYDSGNTYRLLPRAERAGIAESGFVIKHAGH